ncbi:clathrin interactor 1-like isoform X2 [Physella acuta]|uniref:clathrin interactor 1-like isoform X2 n=1 Tax=Physella acuta TaxID=109671 RepID=UPI0027DDCEED|nr:clathrin interactor 1-like isoform X2 [Physella acuta]
MLSTSMWKLRELTDKVTNVVMNYSDVETKVREATNDDAWGPHGSLMKEVAQYTFTYEHFPEVMGMLWKRMLHDNKKNWRRVYKSLILLNYLIKNGSERVVTSSREHIYDLRGLENYSFTDEQGKDQGLNVRHKVKEILDFIQDDDRLREERKKAKKTKDKYVGVSSEAMGVSGGAYSDRYEEEPRSYRERGQMEEIEDWESGKKSVVSGAIDKAKDLWNRAQGRQAPDEIETERYDEDNWEKSREPRDRKTDRYDFKDDDEEYTSVERTQTTKTEKITTNRRSRSIGKKLELGAASSFGKESDSQSQASSTVGDPNLFDLPDTQESFADFSNFSTATTAEDFNPRGGNDFGDFIKVGTSGTSAVSPSFADFSQTSSSQAVNDLLDVFAAPHTSPAAVPIMLPSTANMMSPTTGIMPMMAPNTGSMPMMAPNAGSMPMMTGVMMSPGLSMQTPGINVMPGMIPGTLPNLMTQPMMMHQPNVMMVMGTSPSMQKNTWSDASAKVNINLDSLNPASKLNKPQGPALNQMAGHPQGMLWYPDVYTGMNQGMANLTGMNQGMANLTGMNQGMANLTGMNQGMANLSLQSQPNLMGRPVIGMMPQANMGVQMMSSSNMAANASFQKRTDTAFSAFGNLKN